MSLHPTIPEIEQDILPETTLLEEQTRTLFGSIPLSLCTTILLSVVLSAAQWQVIGYGDLLVWNLLMGCAILLRIVCWYLWRNNTSPINAVHGLIIFRVGVLLAGAAWGSSAFFMFANFNPTYQALLAFTLAGVASGSLTTLAIDKISALGFVALTVLPLTLRLFMEHGPIAVPMGIMSLLYIIFVLSATTRARHNLEDHHHKNSRIIAWSKERSKQQQLSKIISYAQAEFINDTNNKNIFEQLLTHTLNLTDSKFGFIADVVYTTNNQPALKLRSYCNLTQNKHFDHFYQAYIDDKRDDKRDDKINDTTLFTQMDNLLGAAIMKGKFIISNTPLKDMRVGSLPNGHPPLSTFLGIPIFKGSTPVALLGIANNTQGYEENLVDFLTPLTNTISQFIEAIKHSQQKKLFEEKIYHSAKHTQAILDDVFDAILTIDKNGTIQSFNHAAETIFGYRADEIINADIERIIPASKNSPADTEFKKDQNLMQRFNLAGYSLGAGKELTGLRRNGKKFPIEFIISELILGKDIIYIGVVRDISEQKRNEELKNQFISTVSHELRTPLTSIAGALGILNSGSLGKHTEQQQKIITIALNNSTRLQNLINDLLDIEKLLANKIELSIAPICLLQMVHQAIESNQLYADNYKVTLTLSSTQKPTLVYGDAQRVQQVCANLLSNAAKFSHPHSEVNIDIFVTGRFSRVTISDHGVGISEEFKSKIFQRFSQADSSDTRQKGGSGLGLAISKELIQRMGGNIGFTSTQGQGSSFYFELPLTEN